MANHAVKKKVLGQFFTEGSSWLCPQVSEFISSSGMHTAYDPFAGSGCLLEASGSLPGITGIAGLDIDPSLGWPINDSLERIPPMNGAIIVTNPPYLTNYSAARKKILPQVQKYFDMTDYDDLYLLALDRMLDACSHVVAIVPETVINSPYARKDRLVSITVLEDNPFTDTDTPVAVLCFDGVQKGMESVKVYRDGEYLDTLGNIEACRMEPSGDTGMTFNSPDGWLAVRCVDSSSEERMLEFTLKEDMDYDWDGGIKVSSRLMTLVDIDVPVASRAEFIGKCNGILQELRENSHDVILSPFKGNMKSGRRRRRLDYRTCRAIIEKAAKEI